MDSYANYSNLGSPVLGTMVCGPWPEALAWGPWGPWLGGPGVRTDVHMNRQISPVFYRTSSLWGRCLKSRASVLLTILMEHTPFCTKT